MEINVTYEDKQYKLCLKEQSYNLNLNNSNNTKLVISKEADNKINYLGNVVHFKGDKTPPNAVFIDDITVTFTTGQTSTYIDLSSYVKHGVVYYPVFVAASFVASKIESRCVYNANTRRLRLYNDGTVTTGQGETGNTLVLMPMDSDVLSVEGITNGQYNGEYDRYYTKSEVDTALNGKQDTLTFDDTPTQSSNNPVKSGGIYTALSGKVNNTGNETIAGEKTFTSMPTISHDAAGLRLGNPNITKGTSPSSNKYGYVELLDKNGAGNSNRIGLLEFSQRPNGTSVVTIAAYRDVAGSTDRVNFDLVCNQDGTGYATVPTPAVSDDSTKIATTAYVNNKFVEVNALPASPDPDIWYAIPEV